MTRIPFDFSTHALCRNVIAKDGSNGMITTYCQRPLNHAGPCSMASDGPSQAINLTDCPHGYASVGNCGVCRGKL